jgi:hypothetical protein
MKTRKVNRTGKGMPTFAGNDDQYLDAKYLPPEDEADLVSALLHRIADRGNHAAASYAYQDSSAEDDGDAQALHHVVDELQFGHDLRM